MATNLLPATSTSHTKAHLYAGAWLFLNAQRPCKGGRRRGDITSHEWYADVCHPPRASLNSSTPICSVEARHNLAHYNHQVCAQPPLQPFITSRTDFKPLFVFKIRVQSTRSKHPQTRPQPLIISLDSPTRQAGAKRVTPQYIVPLFVPDVWICMCAPPDLHWITCRVGNS